MEDEEVLDRVRQQATGARCVFSVCTGALICGAAGLIKGRRATTHWSAFDLQPFFGAIPVNEHVVMDGKWGLRSRCHCGNRRSSEGCRQSTWRESSSGGSAQHGLCAGAAFLKRGARERATSTNRLLLADHGKNGVICGWLEPGL
jgi:hypothetical protein